MTQPHRSPFLLISFSLVWLATATLLLTAVPALPAASQDEVTPTRFLREASQGGQTEIALSQLAAERATQRPVRLYAEHLVRDHTAVARELHGLPGFTAAADARRDGTLPTATSDMALDPSAPMGGTGATDAPTVLGTPNPDMMPPLAERHVAELKKLSGQEFDRRYVDLMVDEHTKAVDLFAKAAVDDRDEAVRAFASKHLPTLRDHLAQAQKLAGVLAP